MPGRYGLSQSGVATARCGSSELSGPEIRFPARVHGRAHVGSNLNAASPVVRVRAALGDDADPVLLRVEGIL